MKKTALDSGKTCVDTAKKIATKVEEFVNRYFSSLFLVVGIGCSLFFAPEITLVGAAMTFLLRKNLEGTTNVNKIHVATVFNATLGGVGGMGALLNRIYGSSAGSVLPIVPVLAGISFGNTLHSLHRHFYPKK